MRIDIVTLFPEIALAPLSDSIIQRARAAGLVEVTGHQLRDWSEDKHRRVDELGGVVGEPVTDIVESNGVGELGMDEAHDMTPRTESARLLVDAVFGGELGDEMLQV